MTRRQLTILAWVACLGPASILRAQPNKEWQDGFMVNRVGDQTVCRWAIARWEATFSTLACSPKDNLIAFSLYKGLVGIWDPVKEERPYIFDTMSGDVDALAFGPDGATLATVGKDGLLRFFSPDPKPGTKDLRLMLSCKCLCFAPDGKTLALAGSGLRVIELPGGQDVFRQPTKGDLIEAVAYSPDGRVLIIGGKTVQFLDAATGKVLAVAQGAQTQGSGQALAVSQDGKWLASGGTDKKIVLWDLASRKPKKTLSGHFDGITGLAFTPDNKRLISTGHTYTNVVVVGAVRPPAGETKVWDVEKGAWLADLIGHPRGVRRAGVTSNGQFAVTAGLEKVMRLWDLSTVGAPPGPFGGGKVHANALDLTRDGEWLVTADPDKQLRIWETRSGKEIKSVPLAEPVGRLVISPDKKIAYAQKFRTLQKIDFATGKVLHSWPLESYVYGELKLSYDGLLLAVSLGNGSVWVFDVKTEAKVYDLEGHRSTAHSLAFARDDSFLAAAGDNNLVRLWDMAKGTLRQDVKMETACQCMALAPDSQHVVTGFIRWPVRIWNAKSGQEVERFEGLATPAKVTSLAYSPDGKRILVGGENLTLVKDRRLVVDALFLLEADTGKILGSWRAEPGPVRQIRFSNDGQQAFYLSANILWRLDLRQTSGPIQPRKEP